MSFSPYGKRRHRLTRVLYFQGVEALREELRVLLARHYGIVSHAAVSEDCSRQFLRHMIRIAQLDDFAPKLRARVRTRTRLPDALPVKIYGKVRGQRRDSIVFNNEVPLEAIEVVYGERNESKGDGRAEVVRQGAEDGGNR